MRLDEAALTAYLVDHLRSLTSADPTILTKYIIVLLRKDKPTKELRVLCNQSLVEFLGNGTELFVENLFEAIEDGAIMRRIVSAGETMTFEPSSLLLDQEEPQILPPKVEEYSISRKEQGHASSSSSGSDSGSEEQGLSEDDEDDDRNHKHRKRDSRPESLGEDSQGVILRRPIKRPNRAGANGNLFNTSRLSTAKNTSNDLFDRDPLMKFDKQSSGMVSLSRASVDLGQRGRINHSRNGSGSHSDLSSSFSRPSVGRGRARGTGNWNQHDSRFLPVGALDFPSHMAPRGASLPGLFVGTNLPSVAATQNASWGSFGFIPGMPNGCMDPLHPLSMPGALHSTIGPPMNLSIPRQRCRDFEEQGFCLRGDMCPMEHGVNRIVVEDVQSLSQFNLPVTLSNSHTGGLQTTSGSMPSIGAMSTLPRSKSTPLKVNKPSVADDRLGGNEVFSSAAAADNDVYDPDKPLWTNDCLSIPHDPLGAPDSDEPETFQDGDSSFLRDLRLSYKRDNGLPSCSNPDGSSSHGSHGQGKFGSRSKLKATKKMDNAVLVKKFTENDAHRHCEEATFDAHISTQGTSVSTTETSQKISTLAPVPRFHKNPRRNATRSSQRASRTLFVTCIPVKNNRRDAIHAHFQKFGTVIDISIPMNGDKAFVQFSKREEAEAALDSPEAVMGNRFIKLFWANRDNIADDNYGLEDMKSPTGYARAPSVSLKPSVHGNNEPQPSVSKAMVSGAVSTSLVPKVSNAPVVDSTPVQPKTLMGSTPKVSTPAVKKRENLEMLKEEMRRKQELLEQKRIEFKNQLDKLEKQRVIAKKNGVASEKPIKKQKIENDTEATKPVISKLSNSSVSGEPSNAADLNCSMVSFVSEDFAKDSVLVSHAFESEPKVTPYRSEFDNGKSGFIILPPLPPGFANLAVIEDHFSPFQNLVRVILEELQTGYACESSKPSFAFSARVIFSSHHSALRAFSDADCWQGKKLKFVWLKTDSPGSDPGSENSSPNSDGNNIRRSCSDPGAARFSLSNTKVPMGSGVSAAHTRELMDVDDRNPSFESTVEAHSCSRTNHL